MKPSPICWAIAQALPPRKLPMPPIYPAATDLAVQKLTPGRPPRLSQPVNNLPALW
jgi:hypothetical protein